VAESEEALEAEEIEGEEEEVEAEEGASFPLM
jgi:hypothetical protein